MIEKLLVANRGEIARRVMRSAKKMGIACVAVHSDPDAQSPYVAEADEAVRLPGESSADTYLRVEAIVDAASRSGAQAVHPGYGFLSENPELARACESAGLVFVGPPPEVIEAMGSKIKAKETMSEAGVPVLPSVEVPVTKHRRDSMEKIEKSASELGWPVLVKASSGGGGRGMRVVAGPKDLAGEIESARREAEAAFGDATVFIEPYVPRPRHVEVQVVADNHGTVVHLFERECSIQRRHQKIVEEAPSPSVEPRLRAQLGDAALRAAWAIGYVNAGTVEFLVMESGGFAFLEMNTRLQVEHTVTECVTGLDLVRLQLLVADGYRLPPQFLEAQIDGHAIEVRLYAEDPTASWAPSAGRLHRFDFTPGTANVSYFEAGGPAGYGSDGVRIRIDSGVEGGSQVTTHYDPLLAKVISHAPTRSQAARALGSALRRAEIHGLRTNRDLLVRLLAHPEFLDAQIDTEFLERHDPAELGAPLASVEAEKAHAVAAALAAQAHRRAGAPVLKAMPSGWRNVAGAPQRCSFESVRGEVEVSYRFDRTGLRGEVEVDGDAWEDFVLVSCDPGEVVLRLGGVERRYRVQRVGLEHFVDGPDGYSALTEIERFPPPGTRLAAGSLVAPLPGTVVKVPVEVGAQVEAGDVVATIEAMKMEHEVRAEKAGTLRELAVAAGDQVEAGSVLAVVEPDE